MVLMMAMSLLVLLLVCFSGLSAAEFLRVPENQSVGLGLDAVFHCQHRAALSIGWLVDGVSENQLDNSGTYIKSGNYRDEYNSLIYTLTILARPEYNETMIECVATFLDSLPQRSPPVTLIIEDSCGSLSVATAFTIMPLPEGVFADGSDARFECYHRASNRITFEINGLSVNDTIGQNASIITIAAGNGRSMFILEFEATQVLDGSMIVCIAIFANGCPDQQTVPALLLIQGPLSAVTRFRRLPSDQVVYSWTPPPTLPLTGVTTYIVYSFEVYNITCGANDLLISFYNLSGVSYRNVLLDPGHVYKVIIIPRSNVPGAKNGTAHVECERFAKVNVSSVVSMENSLGVVVEFSLESIVDTMNIHARWYSLLLQVVDQPEKRMVLDMDEMMDTTVHVLARRQLFLVTVMAYDCEEHQVSETTIISTHDVQEVSARPITGGISVTGHFITSSSAVGICIIVFSFANEADVNYVFVQRPKEQQEIETTLTGLVVGDYQVSVFVVDDSGLPFNQSADLPSNVSVSEDIKLTETADTMDDHSVILYELQANSTGVYITCTFLDSSTNTCVAVVHQRISQLSSSGLMNIESSHKFNRSGNAAYGCIDGVNLEQYQIGVIGGRQHISQSEVTSRNNSKILVPAVVSVAVVLSISILIILTIILLCLCKKRFPKRYGLSKSTTSADNRNSGMPLKPENLPASFSDKPLISVPSKADETSLSQQVDLRQNEPTHNEQPPEIQPPETQPLLAKKLNLDTVHDMSNNQSPANSQSPSNQTVANGASAALSSKNDELNGGNQPEQGPGDLPSPTVAEENQPNSILQELAITTKRKPRGVDSADTQLKLNTSKVITKPVTDSDISSSSGLTYTYIESDDKKSVMLTTSPQGGSNKLSNTMTDEDSLLQRHSQGATSSVEPPKPESVFHQQRPRSVSHTPHTAVTRPATNDSGDPSLSPEMTQKNFPPASGYMEEDISVEADFSNLAPSDETGMYHPGMKS